MTPDSTIESRLRIARAQKFATASEAARALNISVPTYLAHENGTRRISSEQADFYARRFGVSTDWLLFNRGEMTADGTPEPAAAVGSAILRSSGRHQAANPLLGLLNASYAPDGSLRTHPGASNASPAPLPPVHMMQGFIPELAWSMNPGVDLRRAIQLPPPVRQIRSNGALVQADAAVPPLTLVLVDFVRLPQDMINEEFAFAVKIGGSDLIEGASAVDRAIIDPTDRDGERDGFYAALIGNRLGLVYIETVNGAPDHVMVYEGRRRPPTRLRVGDERTCRIYGRVRHMLMLFSDRLADEFQSGLQTARNRQLTAEGRDRKLLPSP